MELKVKLLELYIVKIYNEKMEEIILKKCIGFEWDSGNQHKNKYKHNVTSLECEQIFFNDPLLVYEDVKHSVVENRLYALGCTDDDRKLFVAFTIRNQYIRVISARDMNKKERGIYEQVKKNS